MPERFAGPGVQGDKVPGRITGEHQITGGTQYGVVAVSTFPFMAPPNLAGLVIDGLHHAFRKPTAIVSSPALGLFVVIEDVVHAEGSSGVDIKQSCIRTVARRVPVGGPALIG